MGVFWGHLCAAWCRLIGWWDWSKNYGNGKKRYSVAWMKQRKRRLTKSIASVNLTINVMAIDP